MSTRSSIGYVGDYHLYVEWRHEDVRLTDDQEQEIRLMPREVWDEMRQQIISGWLKEVSNGHAKLKEVWGKDSIAKLDRDQLIENFERVLAHVEN